MLNTHEAQITKTYIGGAVDILTLSITEARAHVKARIAHPDSFGLTALQVRVGNDTHRWTRRDGWVQDCDFPEVEHPGFPCAHYAGSVA